MKVLIAITTNTGRETWLIPFATTLIQATRHIDSTYEVEIHVFAGLSIDLVRTQAALFCVKKHFDCMIFVDDDQTYPVDAFSKMLAHWESGIPIVSGVYHSKAPPYHAFIYPLDAHDWLREYDPTKIYEVKTAATGCLLIDTKVFAMLPKPWFLLHRDLNGYLSATEDCYFTSMCHKAHLRMIVDASILCGHLRLVSFPQFFEHPSNHYNGEFLPKVVHAENMPEHKGPIIIHAVEGTKMQDGLDKCCHIHQYPVPVNSGEPALWQCLDCGLVSRGEELGGLNVINPYCCEPSDLAKLIEDLDHHD